MQLGQPHLLPVLALAALPVLVHLLARRRRRVMPFAMTRFLHDATLQMQGRRWLRELMLVALRTGAVLFALLSLLRLYAPLSLPLPPAPTALALVVDTSLSLQGGHPAWWRQVQRWCEQLVANIPADIAVVAADRSGEPLVPFTTDRAVLRAALRRLRPTFKALDLTPALQTADALLASHTAAAKRLIVVTDLQSEPFRSLRLPPLRNPLTVVDVKETPAVGNARVDALLRMPLDPQADGQLQVRLRNLSRQPLTGNIALRANAQVVTVRPAQLPAGRELVLAFPLPPAIWRLADRNGWVRCEVRWQANPLAADALALDDRVAFVVRAPHRLRVACAVRQGNTFIVAALRALNLSPLSGWQFDADALIASAPTDLTLTRKVLAWVRQGHNAVIVADAARSPLWAALGLTVRAEPTPLQRVRWTDETVPLLNGLGATLQGVVARPALVQGDNARLRTLVALETGAPLLLELSVGQGRLLLLTVPLTERDGNLVRSPAFVPLIYRLITFAAYKGGVLVPRETDEAPEVAPLRTTVPPLSESDFRLPAPEQVRRALAHHNGVFIHSSQPPTLSLAATPLRDLSPLCLLLSLACLLMEGVLTLRWWRR